MPKALCIDGRDDDLGRGLFVLSALHLAAPQLGDVSVKVLNGDSQPVRTAIDVLRWDCGLRIAAVAHDEPPPWLDSETALFVAIAVRDLNHLPLHALASAEIGTLIGIQFPTCMATCAGFAHNTRLLAQGIIQRLGLQ